MNTGPAVVFNRVWKKFRRGERHDSLRDLLPSVVGRLFARRDPTALNEQQFWALEDVSFEVRRGEAFGIIGPNGAGKSTTLKLLTRILRPNLGSCRTHGRVGALIELAAGFHHDLTGRENVYLQGAIMGMTRAEIDRRFSDIVDFAEVGSFIDTPVKRYSSGMNARLGFSIAAHLDPDVLIIDEVLSVGDMAFQRRCIDRMRAFREQGVAIVFVSHNLQAVSDLCSHALYLNRSVRAIGPCDAVLSQYLGSLGTGSPSDDSSSPFSVRFAALTNEEGQPVASVRPGETLRLRVAYDQASNMMGVTFQFALLRSTDALVVYDGHFNQDELSLREVDGQLLIDYTFKAHLTRGQYHIDCRVVLNATQRILSHLVPAATFTVEETRTYQGVADIGLEVATSGEAESSTSPMTMSAAR